MSEYKLESIQRDTRSFIKSQYGEYLIGILAAMSQGALSNAADIYTPYPDRHLARYAAIKEVLDCIKQPLDDDTSPRG